MRATGPSLGADPVAAVLGGIFFLAASAVLLILRRDRLREGVRLPAWAWIAGGGVGALMIYVVGLIALGRGDEMLRVDALTRGVPWAPMLLVPVGAAIAHSAGRRAGWHWAGVSVLASLCVASAGWAAYLVTSRVGEFVAAPSAMAGALAALLVAQLVALLLVCAVAAYVLDGLVRRTWTRAASRAPHDPTYLPKVAIQIASYDEPPEVVVKTLDSVVAQDYPREKLHIMLVDDSTRPEDVAMLRAACEARGVVFLHREHRSGYKAGALNFALRETPADVEVIAIVDADFVCEPGFVRENVGYFADPKLAFLQTRLAYREDQDRFTSRYASLLEHYFYTSMMHTRNEANAILFAGTMGMLRRSALEEVGAWTDGHVGEDVDLSCRLLMRGWTSLYVPKAYGRGLQTATQEAFRKQQARWAYGGARIARDHAKAIVKSDMSLAQKAHYLYGPIFWLDGALGFLFATSMLFFALAFVSGQTAKLPLHDLVFVGLIPILIILDGMVRSAFTMRRLLGIRFRDVGALILLGWSGKVMNALSACAALAGRPRPFYRTPKEDDARLSRRAAARQALRVAPVETTLAAMQVGMGVAMVARIIVAGTGGIPLALLVGAILMTVVWALYFGAAPVCVYLGHVVKVGPAASPGAPARRTTFAVVKRRPGGA